MEDKYIRLKEIMKERRISGVELARQLGVSASYVNMAASGRAKLSVKQCIKIAEVLNVPLASLFDGYVKPGSIYCPYCGKPFHLIEG